MQDERKDNQDELRSTRVCPNCGLQLAEGTLLCPNDGTMLDGGSDLAQRLRETYDFNSVINNGGMGVIYRAQHKILGKPVAIKMLKPGMYNDSALIRFQREGKTASTLSHPNIVGVYDFGISDLGQPYMVMEFVEGLSLGEKIEQGGAMQISEALLIVSQICDGLEHAHQNGILHRDIKPSNIMILKGTSTIKIVDFGIAKSIDASAKGQTLTNTGEALGSPLYMSPEQSLGQKIDARSDLYSLGCLLFECLTGTPPFFGKTFLDTMMMQINNEPPTLREVSLGRKYPPHLEEVVAKLLKKNPDERYQTAQDVKKALHGIDVRTEAVSDGAAGQPAWLSKLPLIGALCAAVAISGAAAFFMQPHQTPPAKQAESSPQNVAAAKEDPVSDIKDLMEHVEEAKQRMVRSSDDVKEAIRSCKVDNLNLCGDDVRDFDLKLLSNKPNIRRLNLSDTQIGDGGVKWLEGLKLERVNLDSTSISDESLKYLAKIPTLNSLSIRKVDGLSKDGLRTLEKMRNLRELSIGSSNLSEEDIASVHKNMRFCAIDSSLTHSYADLIEGRDNKHMSPPQEEQRLKRTIKEMTPIIAPGHRSHYKAAMRLAVVLSSQRKYKEALAQFVKAYDQATHRESMVSSGDDRNQAVSDADKAAFGAALAASLTRDMKTAKAYKEHAFAHVDSLEKEQLHNIKMQIGRTADELDQQGLNEEAKVVRSWYSIGENESNGQSE